MNHLTVLVVSGGGFAGFAVIKGLRYSKDIRIILADCYEENVSRYFVDKSYVVPRIVNETAFISSLLEICHLENVQLIIPSTDSELFTLAKNIAHFASLGIKVAVSDLALLEKLSSKDMMYRFLLEIGTPVLPILDIDAPDLNYPIIGKPARGSGGKGILIIHSQQELGQLKTATNSLDLVWQPYLRDCDEYSVDFAISFDGQVSQFVIRRRIRTIVGFAVISENIRNAAVEQSLRKLMDALAARGACGIFNVQVLSSDFDFYFSDLNLRIGTSAVYSYGLGLNYPLFMCQSSEPNNPTWIEPVISTTKELKMVRYLDELWIEKHNLAEVKAVIFDLDDTLLDHKTWIFHKLESLNHEYASKLPGKHEFLLAAMRILEEGNRSNLLDVLALEFGLSDNLKLKMIEKYREIPVNECPLYPDVLPTLTELQNIGLRLGLLTDNPPISQLQKLTTCHLLEKFEVVIYARDLGLEKPASPVFVEAARRLNLPPKSLVIVGDNLYRDIVGALSTNYAHGFLIVRPGSFFNFDTNAFQSIFGKSYQYTKINDLRNLMWYLGTAS